MARYAWKHGFRKENDRRFSHTNGSWSARANGARVRYYLPKEHYLKREMLQIETNLWRLMETTLEIHALILADIKDDPTEVTGSRLKAMQAERQVDPYLATYRLVFNEVRSG
ncbi:MAG: hypothetical protein OXC93_13290 [Rhodospirillaceae bacterium]|nr:hypothetical protein [Rhodospirillaceae bacterium]